MIEPQTDRPPAPNLNTHPREYVAAGLSALILIFSFFVFNGVSIGGATYGWNAWSNVLTVFASLFNLVVLAGCVVYLVTPYRLPTIDKNKLGPWSQLSLITALNLFLVMVRLLWVLADSSNDGDPQWALYATLIGLIGLALLLRGIANRAGENKPVLRRVS